MNYWARKLFVGVLLLAGLLSGAHAVYVDGNPLSYTDPEGLNPKGFPRKPIDLLPLDGGGGGGGGYGGAGVGARSPLSSPVRAPVNVKPAGGQQPSTASAQCPPEVQATLERIRAGQGFPHRNDGAVFQNREGLLPVKPDGYYREWVHPTAGGQGPGSQRVVTGQGGEVYYTPDHYRTFVPVP